MKKDLIIFILLSFISIQGFPQINVASLLCENRINPVGLSELRPSLSWKIVSAKRNTVQSAYEIRVALNASALSASSDRIWNSGKVLSDQSVYVPYDGAALQSNKKYYWQVRIWDNTGKASAWSAPASWHTGLLKKEDWKAKWIGPAVEEDKVNQPSPLLRKEFQSGKKISSAMLFVTAHGLYEAQINSQRVGDAYLTPGWTSYRKRLQYQAYDVTSMIRNGNNAIGVCLGSGWYRGNLAFLGRKNIYGEDLGLLLQLEIKYADGSAATIVSDDSWKSATGPIRSSEIYHGELYDARLEETGWASPSFDDKDWSAVAVRAPDTAALIGTYNEPVRKHEIFTPVKIFKTPKGEQVVDFGQNLVGWVQLKVTGKAGDSIKISHAEILDKFGNFYTENLRLAKQLNTYVLKGAGEEIFEPHFTFQGFRYIKLEGFTGQVQPKNVTAVALYSDMPITGNFESSDTLLNQLQHNIQWGQKGNFVDVPTDCPQRDERLGWTGDAQVFFRTASFNMGVHNFFSKWLGDLAADQTSDGRIPFVVPNALDSNDGGSAGWADAITIIPWNMYIAYGDKRIPEKFYGNMKAWVNYMERTSRNDLWNTGFHFGDWLFYRPDDDNDGRAALTDKYLIAQCFFAHSTQLLINAARLLNENEDEARYTDLLKKVKAAFLKEYVTPGGRLVSSSQTAYVLALHFDMLPESLRQQAAERLADNIKSYGNHLTTGFLGTPYLCHVLTRFGYNDLAYALLMQKTYPSWLYPVTMGATTIWERWDGQKPDSTFQTPGMNSFNHYSYGAIGDWIYRVATGINTEESAPGYKKITIMPYPGGGLTYARSSLETYYGRVSSGWKKINGHFQYDIEIPANTTATIYLPAKDGAAVKENNRALSAVSELKVTGTEGQYIVIRAGSGKYNFTVD